MKLKNILYISVCFCIVGLLLANSTYAFPSSSFSQNAGEIYNWNKNGIIVSINITTANTTKLGGVPPFYDTLYGIITQGGTPLNTMEIWLWRYNSTFDYEENVYSILPGRYYFIIPHNETAVKTSINTTFTNNGYSNFTWISGPNGYDGQASANMPDSTNPSHIRSVYKFNSEGLLDWARSYQGSTTGWTQFSYIFLSKDIEIPGFSTAYLIFFLALLAIAFSVFRTNKQLFKL